MNSFIISIWKFYMYVVLYNCLFKILDALYVVKPTNTVVIRGQSVTLNCTIANAGKIGNNQSWKYFERNSTAMIISTNDKIVQQFNANFQILGVYNLKILSAKLEDGGRYNCENSPQSGSAEDHYVYVTVVDTPVLTLPQSRIPALEYDIIRYNCDVTYGGLWPPQVRWNSSVAGDLSHISHSCSTSGQIRTYIEFEATLFNDSEVFSCEVKFQENIVITAPNTAVNVPEYARIIPSKALEINYSPRNIAITFTNGSIVSNNSVLFPGTEIACGGDSKPPVETYTWISSDTNEVIGRSSSLHVNDSVPGLITFRCELFNTLSQKGSLLGWGMETIQFIIPANLNNLTTAIITKTIVTTAQTSRDNNNSPGTTQNIPDTTQMITRTNPPLQVDDSTSCMKEQTFWIVVGVLIVTTVLAVIIVILCAIKMYRERENPKPIPNDLKGTVHQRTLPVTPLNPMPLDYTAEDSNYHQISDNPNNAVYQHLSDASTGPTAFRASETNNNKVITVDNGRQNPMYDDHDYQDEPTTGKGQYHNVGLLTDHGYCEPLKSVNSSNIEPLAKPRVDYITL